MEQILYPLLGTLLAVFAYLGIPFLVSFSVHVFLRRIIKNRRILVIIDVVVFCIILAALIGPSLIVRKAK